MRLYIRVLSAVYIRIRVIYMHADWVFSVFNGTMEYIANNEIRLTILTHEISL